MVIKIPYNNSLSRRFKAWYILERTTSSLIKVYNSDLAGLSAGLYSDNLIANPFHRALPLINSLYTLNHCTLSRYSRFLSTWFSFGQFLGKMNLLRSAVLRPLLPLSD